MMDGKPHLLCRWKGRLWPARVLGKASNCRRKNNVEVEILGEEKRIWTAEGKTQPMTETTINRISQQLGPVRGSVVEELKYRRSLRLALDVFHCGGSPSPPSFPRRSPRLSSCPPTQALLTKPADGRMLDSVGSCKEKRAGGKIRKGGPSPAKERRSQRDRAELQSDNGTNSNPGGSRKTAVTGQEKSSAILTNPHLASPASKGTRHSRELSDSPTPFTDSGASHRASTPVSRKRRVPVSQEAPLHSSTPGLPASCLPPRTSTRHRVGAKRRKLFVSSTPDKQERCSEALPGYSVNGATGPVEVQESHAEGSADGDEPGESGVQSQEGPKRDVSSELSIELSVHETGNSEEDGELDEDELPSFLLSGEQKSMSIKEGMFVWCKIRHFPHWPAIVKHVKHKRRKASIIFIDDTLDQTRPWKGFGVSLKNVKIFNCEESKQLEVAARESHNTAITWCLELIRDYTIRKGCGSFSGSFLEYFADDISSPVRRPTIHSAYNMSFPTTAITEEQEVVRESPDCDSTEQQGKDSSRKLLPDRCKAGRNRANKKLVEFIVKQRGAERHLQAVISGQVPSRWLKAFLRVKRAIEATYLEDEDQIDQVYRYLRDVYENAHHTSPRLAQVDKVQLIMDVLLPEALVRAIANTENMSLKKAEDKYMKGPSLSKREKEEFDMRIRQNKRESSKSPP